MSVIDPMMEMYLFETGQLVNRLEQLCMESERKLDLSEEIEEIFRIMHTIKGNSMMMLLEDIGKVAHRIEDLFDYLKEVTLGEEDIEKIIDYNFEVIDFLKRELSKLERNLPADGDSSDIVSRIDEYLRILKKLATDEIPVKSKETVSNQKYFIAPSSSEPSVIPSVKSENIVFKIKLFFSEDAQMENVRAFSIIHNMKEFVDQLHYYPSDIVENEGTIEQIRSDGFKIYCSTAERPEKIHDYFNNQPFLEMLEVNQITEEEFLSEIEPSPKKKKVEVPTEVIQTIEKEDITGGQQKFISVEVNKVDKLMDLVGELVVAESMVINNSDIVDLKLSNFDKASRQLRLVINEMQDVIMSVRMVPLTMTFQKMSRIVRDMKKKIDKDVKLVLNGEETEVDKNVIEKIADPLMHIIRNAMDHGIEDKDVRLAHNKPAVGQISLSAKHVGGNVVISIKDDGKGLDKESIYEKAFSKGLIEKPIEECSDQEIYNMIMTAGFSTKEEVTEFSGRGVGMDVVQKNIDSLSGDIYIDSEIGKGTEISIMIPLTLAIIDGMMMRVGQSIFTLPTLSIKESFIVEPDDVINDPEGQEMVMIRGKCYPVIRLRNHYQLNCECEEGKGIFVMIEHDEKHALLFADELIGEQQVVVKNLSKFINKVKGISGFALLGDGRISMILDPSGFVTV